MKSIDKLNNAVIRKGKQVAQSEIGRKVVNSGAGKKVKSAIHNAEQKGGFVANLTGYNVGQAQENLSHRLDNLTDMELKNPNFRANRNTVRQHRETLGKARDGVLEKDRKLSKMRDKIHSYGDSKDLSSEDIQKKKDLIQKYDKRMDKKTKPELDAYRGAKNDFESMPEFKTHKNMREDVDNLYGVYNKAMRDTRNARRALTGGVIATGIGVPTAAKVYSDKKKEQDQLNQARMSYYY